MKNKTSTHICKACNNSFTGKYCNQCGEKFFDEHSKSVSHLGEEAFHFLTHFEGSFFTTLKTVFFKPGRLSIDYCNGIRKKYFKPVPFFLFIVVLYLLFPRFQGLNMRLDTYVTIDYNYHHLALAVAKKKLIQYNGDYAAMAVAYDTKSAKLAKPLIFIMIPVTGLLLFGFFYKKRGYYFDHLIYATEFNALYIGFSYLIMPLLMVAISSAYPSTVSFFADDGPGWLLSNCIMCVYLVVAFRRFYSLKWMVALPLALLFFACYLLLLGYFYKMVLYYCVMFLI